MMRLAAWSPIMAMTRAKHPAALPSQHRRCKHHWSHSSVGLERTANNRKVLGSSPSGTTLAGFSVPGTAWAISFLSLPCRLRSTPKGPAAWTKLLPHRCDSVSEWLRRWTRNPLGSARRGSNPLTIVPCHRSLSLLIMPGSTIAVLVAGKA